MSYDVPDDRRYTAEHLWLRVDGSNPDDAVVGITDFAQQELGDVVYVEVITNGSPSAPGDPLGEIESAKAVSELVVPIACEIVAHNERLDDRPELVNESPYGDGWIARLRLHNRDELSQLLDAAAYRAMLPELID